MPRIILIFFLIATCFLPACTTISRSSMDHFRIDSVPQGAKVETSLETDESLRARQRNPELVPQYYGCPQTPCAIEMPRRSVFVATITHPEYQPAEIGVGFSSDRQNMVASMTGNTATSVAAGGAAGAAAGTALIGVTTTALIAPNVVITALGGQAVSTPTAGVVAGATSAGLGVGLAFGLTSAVVDSASGAYLDLTPNPVVVVLAPPGAPTVTDPNVALVREFLAAESAQDAPARSNALEERRQAAEARRAAKRRSAAQ